MLFGFIAKCFTYILFHVQEGLIGFVIFAIGCQGWCFSYVDYHRKTDCRCGIKLFRSSFLQYQSEIRVLLSPLFLTVKDVPLSHFKVSLSFSVENFTPRFLWIFLDLLCESLHTFSSPSQHFYLSSETLVGDMISFLCLQFVNLIRIWPPTTDLTCDHGSRGKCDNMLVFEIFCILVKNRTIYVSSHILRAYHSVSKRNSLRLGVLNVNWLLSADHKVTF